MQNATDEASGTPPAERAPEVSEPSPGRRAFAAERPIEVGGRSGPEPTRYGDWEKNGRCIDF
jgi:hypothetical protein